MIFNWVRRKLAVRSSKKLMRFVKGIVRKQRDRLAPGEAEHAEIRILACEEAIKNNSLHEIRTSRKALRIFFEDNLMGYDKSPLRKNVEAIVIAIALALLIRAFVVQPFKIPSGSMLPTLLVGDHILINKFVYGTKIPFTDKLFFPFSEIGRGDIVVFKLGDENVNGEPSLGKGVFYIKRTVAVAGDEIDIKGRDLFINGSAVSQIYTGDYEYSNHKFLSVADRYEQSLFGKGFSVIYSKGASSTTRGKMSFPLVVPEDRIFVMGDNRDNSYDSRFWGFVPVENVYGRAFMIHWSWNLSAPDLQNKVRWGRIFSEID